MKNNIIRSAQRPKIIAALLQRDGSLNCHYCGIPLAMTGAAKRTTNALGCIDHKLPLNAGGTNDLENLVLACQSCSCRRRFCTYEELMILIQRERDGSLSPIKNLPSRAKLYPASGTPPEFLTASQRRELIVALVERDGRLNCRYCGVSLVLDSSRKLATNRLARLHRIVRLSAGGTNDLDNLVLVCTHCIHK
jgi:5-methylcytosine-specific restriction endonuclease McrA